MPASNWLTSILDEESAVNTGRFSDSNMVLKPPASPAEHSAPVDRKESQHFQSENEFLESLSVESPPIPEETPPVATEIPDETPETSKPHPVVSEKPDEIAIETREEKTFRVIGEAFST